MKISELPVGSTIEVNDAGRYEKGVDDIWQSTSNENDTFSSAFLDQEEYNNKIRLIAMPWGIVAQLVMMLQDEYGYVDAEGEDITFDSVFVGAVENHNDYLRRKVQESTQKAQ